MATTTAPLFTFQDVAEQIWESFNPATKPPTGRELRMAKQAIVTAYRDLVNAHPWCYYQRRTTLATESSQSSSTIAYDHTGGAYERMVTIAAGTWPANAAYGTLVINDVHYDVDERKSPTQLTLTAASNPGADVAAGTSYLWYRDTYPLPADYRSLQHLVDCADPGRGFLYVDPPSQFLDARVWATVGDPDSFTIRADGAYVGGLSLVFSPAPQTGKTYDLLYDAMPRQLATYKYATGSITLAAGATAVVGTGTAFTSAQVGAVMRFTTSTTVEPTDVVGLVDGTANPYLTQRIITAVTDGTHLTIDSAVSATVTLTGTKYTISDPIDVEPLVMRSCLEALCLYHYARLTKRKDQQELRADARQALLEAMANDSRARFSVRAVPYGTDPSWASVWGNITPRPDA